MDEPQNSNANWIKPGKKKKREHILYDSVSTKF